MPDTTQDLLAGARNLLQGCGGARAGERLLLAHECESLGHYDRAAREAVVACAEALGLEVELVAVPFMADAPELSPELLARIAAADLTVFLARLGDHLRFSRMPEGARVVVDYAVTGQMLASGFGTAPYGGFVDLKRAIDGLLREAREIRVTCPLGTDFRGAVPDRSQPAPDTSVRRFPLSVFAPLDARGYEGRVALPGFLVGTGSRYYRPYACEFRGPVLAHFAQGRLLGFEGGARDVALAEAHYDAVARRYGIDRDAVHSWHAGIHPGCAYPGAASGNWERWSGVAFGNPRILHFHTCGGYAPGEISWNVIDPDVRIDGVPVWQAGRLEPAHVPGAAAILARHPQMAALFAAPAQAIGLDPALEPAA
jgi:hypothetical protein